jgi:hypothetical protein
MKDDDCSVAKYQEKGQADGDSLNRTVIAVLSPCRPLLLYFTTEPET